MKIWEITAEEIIPEKQEITSERALLLVQFQTIPRMCILSENFRIWNILDFFRYVGIYLDCFEIFYIILLENYSETFRKIFVYRIIRINFIFFNGKSTDIFQIVFFIFKFIGSNNWLIILLIWFDILEKFKKFSYSKFQSW